MAIDPEWAALPFEEAIQFFRDKLNIDTASYLDMLGAEHAKAFTTAGSVYADILVDMRDAVDEAIAEGVSIQQFQKRFAEIVAAKGWEYFGTEAWRSNLIYLTNMRTAYLAGRWEQMQAIKDRRPYMQYVHSGKPKGRRREKHAAWDGLVLRADDPWWQTHYPPNGWGCGCTAFSLSERDVEREGLTVGDSPKIEYYGWENPKTGEVMRVPEGLDPGWDYNVGIEQHQPNLDEYPDSLAGFMRALGIGE